MDYSIFLIVIETYLVPSHRLTLTVGTVTILYCHLLRTIVQG